MQKSKEARIKISVTVFSAAVVFLSLGLPLIRAFTDGAPLLSMTGFVESVVETVANPYTRTFLSAVTVIF